MMLEGAGLDEFLGGLRFQGGVRSTVYGCRRNDKAAVTAAWQPLQGRQDNS